MMTKHINITIIRLTNCCCVIVQACSVKSGPENSAAATDTESPEAGSHDREEVKGHNHGDDREEDAACSDDDDEVCITFHTNIHTPTLNVLNLNCISIAKY